MAVKLSPEQIAEMVEHARGIIKSALDTKVFTVEFVYQIPEINFNILKIANNDSEIIRFEILEDFSPGSQIGIDIKGFVNPVIDRKLKPLSTLPKGLYTAILDGNDYVVVNYMEYSIPTIVGTATDAEVLAGKTYYSDVNELRTGTMQNLGKITIEPSEVVQTIVPGYYEEIIVKAYSLTELTGDATILDVVSGRTFYSNSNELKIGIIPDRGTLNVVFDESLHVHPRGYYEAVNIELPPDPVMVGTATPADVKGSKTFYSTSHKNIQEGDIVVYQLADVEHDITEPIVLGKGFYESFVVKPVPPTVLDGTAEENHVLAGKKFYSKNLELKTGTLVRNPLRTIKVSTVDQVIPEGLYQGIKLQPKDEITLTGTAQPSDVLNTETFYNTDPEIRLNGNIPVNGAQTITLASSPINRPLGYYESILVKGKTPPVLTGNAVANRVMKGFNVYGTDPFNKIEGTIETYEVGPYSNLVSSVLLQSGYYKQITVNPRTAPVLDGTATAEKVLAGFDFYNTDALRKVSGTLQFIPVTTVNNPGSAVEYNNVVIEEITVAPRLLPTMTGNAIEANVFEGVKFYSNNPLELKTGTLPVYPPETVSSVVSDIVKPRGFYTELTVAAQSLPTLVGNAAPADVLANETFFSNDPLNKQTGNIVVNPSEVISNVVTPIVKNEGYYQEITVQPRTLPALTGTATENDVVDTRTFYSDTINKKTGNIPIRSMEASTLKASEEGKLTLNIGRGLYTTGRLQIIDNNFISDKIVEGEVFLGVTGTKKMSGEIVPVINGVTNREALAQGNINKGNMVGLIAGTSKSGAYEKINDLLSDVEFDNESGIAVIEDQYVILGSVSYPYLRGFDSKLNMLPITIDIQPPGAVFAIKSSKDGKRLYVSHDGAPYLTIYSLLNGELSKDPGLEIAPLSPPTSIAVASNEDVTLTFATSPYMINYSFENDTLVKKPYPATMSNVVTKNAQYFKIDTVEYLEVIVDNKNIVRYSLGAVYTYVSTVVENNLKNYINNGTIAIIVKDVFNVKYKGIDYNFAVPENIKSLSLSEDSKTLLIGSESSKLNMYELTLGETLSFTEKLNDGESMFDILPGTYPSQIIQFTGYVVMVTPVDNRFIIYKTDVSSYVVPITAFLSTYSDIGYAISDTISGEMCQYRSIFRLN